MLLKEVRIENFRALKDVWAPLHTNNVLIGENNAGKTTFLQAVAFLFNAWRPQPEDIYCGLDEEKSPQERALRVDGCLVPEGADDFADDVRNLLGDAIQLGVDDEPPVYVALRAELAWDEAHAEFRVSRRFQSSYCGGNPLVYLFRCRDRLPAADGAESKRAIGTVRSERRRGDLAAGGTGLGVIYGRMLSARNRTGY